MFYMLLVKLSDVWTLVLGRLDRNIKNTSRRTGHCIININGNELDSTQMDLLHTSCEVGKLQQHKMCKIDVFMPQKE